MHYNKFIVKILPWFPHSFFLLITMLITNLTIATAALVAYFSSLNPHDHHADHADHADPADNADPAEDQLDHDHHQVLSAGSLLLTPDSRLSVSPPPQVRAPFSSPGVSIILKETFLGLLPKRWIPHLTTNTRFNLQFRIKNKIL